MLEEFKDATPLFVSAFFLLVNFFTFFSSIFLCWTLGVVFGKRRIFQRWEPLRTVEIGAAILATILNAIVSVFGWWLWKLGSLTLQPDTLGRVAIDAIVMILAMDLGMYLFHRLAHLPAIYRLIHRFHHRHESTNPISLFVLHPIEVLGFGAIMISFLVLYPMTVSGLLIFLTLNVLFGTLGHSGVEPLPSWFARIPLLKYIGTSTFHAEDHEHPRYNFGFYTLLWDKIFGTLDPDYPERFSQAAQSAQTHRSSH